MNTANHEPIFSQFPTQASASTDVTKSKTLLTTGIPDCQYSPRKKLDRIPPKRIARVIGNGLYVKEGKNRLAGEALFSRVTIQKGCLITEYAGVKRLLSQKDKAYYKNHFQEATHFASIDSMTVVDGYKEVSKGMHAGSKANDSTFRKLLPADKRQALAANAKIVRRYGKLYLEAISEIKPYQEIYWEYGLSSYIEPAERQGVMPTREVVAQTYLRQHFCQTCGVAFKTRSHLQQHQSVHTTTKDFECDQCEKAYSRESCLNRHKKKNHSKPSKSEHRLRKPKASQQRSKQPPAFSCDFCPRKFQYGGNLQKHLLLHAGIKKYACKGCGRQFSQSSNKNRHQLICQKMKNQHIRHNEQKCPYCPFSTLQKSNLNRHLVNRHNQQGQYACTECTKTFTSPSDLALHSWSHKKLKQFDCSQCSASFVQKQGLTRHIRRLHTKERPHHCSQCPKAYVCPSDLESHVLRVHKGR